MPLQELLTRANTLLMAEAARYAAGLPERVPFQPPDFQRNAVELLRGMLVELGGKGRSESANAGQVPLLWCVAAVAAGERAFATIRVANDEAHPLEASVYLSNLIADTGYDIPSLVASVVPRVATIEPGGEVAFEIALSVPAQTPRGIYSGLVQVTNTKYVKAVLMMEVT